MPCLDKNGVENGDSSKNRAPHEHKRDDHEQPLYPENAALMKRGAARQDRIVAVLHCPWILGEWNDRTYFVGPNHEEFWNKQHSDAAVLARPQTGQTRFREQDGLPFGTARNMDENWHSSGSVVFTVVQTDHNLTGLQCLRHQHVRILQNRRRFVVESHPDRRGHEANRGNVCGRINRLRVLLYGRNKP